MTHNLRCEEIITIPEEIDNLGSAFAYQKNSSLRLLFDHQVYYYIKIIYKIIS